jgi:hypothetical protein
MVALPAIRHSRYDIHHSRYGIRRAEPARMQKTSLRIVVLVEIAKNIVDPDKPTVR